MDCFARPRRALIAGQDSRAQRCMWDMLLGSACAAVVGVSVAILVLAQDLLQDSLWDGWGSLCGPADADTLPVIATVSRSFQLPMALLFYSMLMTLVYGITTLSMFTRVSYCYCCFLDPPDVALTRWGFYVGLFKLWAIFGCVSVGLITGTIAYFQMILHSRANLADVGLATSASQLNAVLATQHPGWTYSPSYSMCSRMSSSGSQWVPVRIPVSDIAKCQLRACEPVPSGPNATTDCCAHVTSKQFSNPNVKRRLMHSKYSAAITWMLYLELALVLLLPFVPVSYRFRHGKAVLEWRALEQRFGPNNGLEMPTVVIDINEDEVHPNSMQRQHGPRSVRPTPVTAPPAPSPTHAHSVETDSHPPG